MPLYRIYNYIKNEVQEINISNEDLESLNEEQLALKYFGKDPEIKSTDCECGARYTSFPNHHSDWCIRHPLNHMQLRRRSNDNEAIIYKRKIAKKVFDEEKQYSYGLTGTKDHSRKESLPPTNLSWYDLDGTCLDDIGKQYGWDELDNKILNDFDSDF